MILIIVDDGTIIRRSAINNQEKIVTGPFQQGKLNLSSKKYH